MFENSKWYEEEPVNSFNFNYKSKKNRMHMMFDPFSFAIGLLILSSILSCIVYYLLNFNLESEINFYHQIIAQQNQTLSEIEIRIKDHILSMENLQKFNEIIFHIDRISNQLNITQIQNNLQDIANVIRHYVPPSS
jgi:hypothetical protein